MRHPRAPAWARPALFAAALISATAALAPSVSAQEKFDSLFVFGDSYADLTLSDKPASNPLAPPGLQLNFWRVYPVPLAKDLGIPGTLITDVAVGGATADPKLGTPNPLIAPGIPVPPNLPEQVQAFLGSNPSFGPRDLVTINIGGNDIRNILTNSLTNPAANLALGYPASITPANAKDFANKTTGYASDQIKLLVNAGARNFVLGEFSTISGLPELQDNISGLPKATADFISTSADNYAKAYFEGMQTQLVPLANSGVRFFMFDLARLGDAVKADIDAGSPKYGFSGGFRCPSNGLPGLLSGICGATLGNPTNNNPLQNQYYFGPDGLHLTNAGFALVAAYMANIVMAPDTIAAQPGIVMNTASNFTGSLLGRLDAVREQGNIAGFTAPSGDGPMSLGRGSDRRAAQPGSPSRLTAFTLGTLAGGDRSGSPDLAGFDYTATSGTVGLEYRVNPNLVVGLAGNFTTAGANLDNGASADIDAIQAAIYASYTARHWFGDALVALGHHDLDLARPGIIDTIRGSTDAASFAAAAKGGYLFDFGKLRAGPIAGLTYIHSRVDGYTETGDGLLTYNVSGQTLETLTGNVGVQLRAPFVAGGNVVSPFLNVTLEHQFGDNTRTLTASLVQAPILPILTPVPNFDTRTYGRVEGGVTFEIGPNVSATINASSTFARDDANDWRISTGVNYRF